MRLLVNRKLDLLELLQQDDLVQDQLFLLICMVQSCLSYDRGDLINQLSISYGHFSMCFYVK